MSKIVIIFIMALFLEQGCGVRGDPVPPRTATRLGRGEPTYRGATENLAIPNVPPVYAPKAKNKKDNQDEKKQ